MDKIAEFWNRVQRSLFSHLDICLPVVTEKHRHLAVVLEMVRIEEQFHPAWARARGRRPADRGVLARAFVAKCVYNLTTTKALIERLHSDASLRQICGWSINAKLPSESTFSRAFSDFAHTGLADNVHEQLVGKYLGDELVWHLSRDSTAICAREKATTKPAKVKRKRGRPGKNDPPAIPKRIFQQLVQTPSEAIAALPKACDVGVKPDSSGQRRPWVGYKFHVDVADFGIPISALTTSASLHDSQAAIPLAKMSAKRVRSLYDLMDSAYDCQTIHEASELLGHVPIIDPAPIPGSSKKKPPMEPDRANRYKNRTTSERFNSHLKDNRGGRNIYVRGQPKVHAHLMFGVIVIFAEAMLGFLP
jgi:transposase